METEWWDHLSGAVSGFTTNNNTNTTEIICFYTSTVKLMF